MPKVVSLNISLEIQNKIMREKEGSFEDLRNVRSVLRLMLALRRPPIEEASALVVRQALSRPRALTGISTSRSSRSLYSVSEPPIVSRETLHILLQRERFAVLIFFLSLSSLPFSPPSSSYVSVSLAKSLLDLPAPREFLSTYRLVYRSYRPRTRL